MIKRPVRQNDITAKNINAFECIVSCMILTSIMYLVVTSLCLPGLHLIYLVATYKIITVSWTIFYEILQQIELYMCFILHLFMVLYN